jgi:RNA polymerase sigma-70 factor (ECF subfamily)
MVTDDWYREIHDRMLAGDPIASSELAETVLDRLVSTLTRKYPGLRDSVFLADAVTDALMAYLKNPGAYDPSKRGLFGYLMMSAEGDLRNALERARRRTDREGPLEVVELGQFAGNVDQGDVESVDQRIDAERLQSRLTRLFPDQVDQQLAQLILDGERATETYAQLLGLQDLESTEQQREVKRHKDRIKKRLQRLGESLNE